MESLYFTFFAITSMFENKWTDKQSITYILDLSTSLIAILLLFIQQGSYYFSLLIVGEASLASVRQCFLYITNARLTSMIVRFFQNNRKLTCQLRLQIIIHFVYLQMKLSMFKSLI